MVSMGILGIMEEGETDAAVLGTAPASLFDPFKEEEGMGAGCVTAAAEGSSLSSGTTEMSMEEEKWW